MSQREITLRDPAWRDPKSKSVRAGFTLLEILVAVAIIAVIVSMVYGSYFATARSTEAYDATMELSEQARQALAQMARQIRCVYAPPLEIGNSKFEIRNSEPEAWQSVVEKTPNYFNGGVDGLTHEILQLVTTDSSLAEPESKSGLFEIIYRFDKSSGLLSLSQQRFIERREGAANHRNWQPVLTGVENFEITFYEGQKWLDKWDFKKERRLPLAVKIDIACQDKNYRRCRYATVAYLPCHKNQGKKTADTSISIEKQWD